MNVLVRSFFKGFSHIFITKYLIGFMHRHFYHCLVLLHDSLKTQKELVRLMRLL